MPQSQPRGECRRLVRRLVTVEFLSQLLPAADADQPEMRYIYQ